MRRSTSQCSVGKAVEPYPSPERAVSGQAHQQQVRGQMREVLPPEARPVCPVLDRGHSGPQVELAPVAGGPSVVEPDKQVPCRLIRIDEDRLAGVAADIAEGLVAANRSLCPATLQQQLPDLRQQVGSRPGVAVPVPAPPQPLVVQGQALGNRVSQDHGGEAPGSRSAGRR